MSTLFSFFKRKLSQVSHPAKSGISLFKNLMVGLRQINFKNFSQNPLFYFGLAPFVLFGLLFISSDSLAGDAYLRPSNIPANVFFNGADQPGSAALFFSQRNVSPFETPDLKIIQDNSLASITTPGTMTTQTLGNMFGTQPVQSKDEIDYVVGVGDTMASLAAQFQISRRSIAWANDITENATLKVGQSLVIPPADGVFYIVKSGDTIFDIAKKYKSEVAKIIAFNGLKDEGDIFTEDVIFLPDGQMPAKPLPSVVQAPIADSFFIYPTQGVVSQGPHGFLGRGIDVANKCGTPVYAAAAGVVQRAQFNAKYGNFVTISHPTNGTSTYYGHLQSIAVKAGEAVSGGQMIGLMGRTGTAATGCHLHLEVRGAKNFLAKFGLGALVSFK